MTDVINSFWLSDKQTKAKGENSSLLETKKKRKKVFPQVKEVSCKKASIFSQRHAKYLFATSVKYTIIPLDFLRTIPKQNKKAHNIKI